MLSRTTIIWRLNTAKMLHDLNLDCDDADCRGCEKLAITGGEDSMDLELDEMQRQAVMEAVRSMAC